MLTPRARSQTQFLLIWGVLWRLAAIALAIYSVWRARFTLVIVLLSVILTFMIHPIVERGCRLRPRWFPRHSWRFTVTLAVFLTLIAFCVVTVREIWAPFQVQLAGLQNSMDDYQKVAREHLAVMNGWYNRLPPQMRNAMHDALAGRPAQGSGEPIAGATTYLFEVLKRIIASTVAWMSHIWELFLIPVLAFYFCLDSRSLKRELMVLVPYRRVREVLFILRHTGQIMQNYIVAQLLLCLIAGLAVGTGLWALDVPYPLVLAVLAGVTRAVPIVGPVFSAIPITLLSVAISLKLGLSVLGFFCTLHLVESKVLLPQLVGHRIKLHPAIILIVLLVGGEFFGIMGMFLAAPVAAIMRMLVNLYLVEPELRRRKAGIPEQDGHAPEPVPADDVPQHLRKVG